MTAARAAHDLVRAVLDDAIATGATPGAAALVVSGGHRAVWTRGTLHRGTGARRVDEDTVWDLASLTKLLSTTVLCADAVFRGEIDLDETAWAGWPGVRVAHLLRHDSGLPAWRAFHEEVRARGLVARRGGRDVVIDAVHATAPEGPPDSTTRYSDLGFIALGALLEARRGVSLDVQFADVRDRILHAPGLRYVVVEDEGFHPAVPAVAPTERCPWRRRVLYGQVHDDNAYAMGGVAGHAGLFGSLRDVEAAGRAMLRAIVAPSTPFEHTLSSWAHASGPRGLGFDRVTAGGSTGDALGPRTVGHLGFTGTSLWLDPDVGDDGALFALLTNRVHETRTHEGIKQLRPAFHRAARAWLDVTRERA